eukprot:scaffold13751_cov108-Isochrysis_galbana.AAC.10
MATATGNGGTTLHVAQTTNERAYNAWLPTIVIGKNINLDLDVVDREEGRAPQSRRHLTAHDAALACMCTSRSAASVMTNTPYAAKRAALAAIAQAPRMKRSFSC